MALETLSSMLSSAPVGVIEGGLAGASVEGFNIAEQDAKKTWRNRVLGLVALGAGVVAGHKFGHETVAHVQETVGDAAVDFVPAIAVGGLLAWRNLKNHSPHQLVSAVAEHVPGVAVGAFAAYQGAEAGIVGGSTGMNVLATAGLAAGGFLAGGKVVEGFKYVSDRVGTRFGDLGRKMRMAALVPAGVLAFAASPELVEHPSMAGAVVAGAGVLAVGAAIGSELMHHTEELVEETA